MIKLSDFTDYLTDQIGMPYVWGGQHLKLTPDNYVAEISKRESDPSNRNTAIAFCAKLFQEGCKVLYAYDCSGLGMYFLQNLTHEFPHDMTADGMMGKCDIVTEPKNGYWVFRVNDKGHATHIGYMVSDTDVIHAKGRAYGVVRERFKESYWHKVGKPRCVDFGDEPKCYEIKVNGSVRVRDGNGVTHKKIATVKNCRLPYLGQDEKYPNWYITMVNGQQGWITSNPKYTQIVEAFL